MTAPTTTVLPVTTTTAAPSTTSTVAEATVGDPAALQALAEQVAADSLIPIEEFFIPNITQPDPIEALKELAYYSEWMASNHPIDELTAIHTVQGSPANTAERIFIEGLNLQEAHIEPPTPYERTSFEIMDLDDLPMSASTRASIPEGSVGIRFLSTSDGYDVISEVSGELVDRVDPWTNLEVLVAVTPTEYGWQEYWYTVQ